MEMKITQSWKRNAPTTVDGDSITLVTVFSSFDEQEINDLEEKMPKATLTTLEEKTDAK